MIRLSNGYSLKYVVASGSLAFDGKGWPWERPMVRAGLIRPDLFTVVLKTLTRHPRAATCAGPSPGPACGRPGGAVNKVGLTNPGFDWWLRDVGPTLDYARVPTVASIFGDEDELAEMARMLDPFGLVGLEVNPSCPNTGHAMQTTEMVVRCVAAVRAVSRHPVIVKVSTPAGLSGDRARPARPRRGGGAQQRPLGAGLPRPAQSSVAAGAARRRRRRRRLGPAGAGAQLAGRAEIAADGAPARDRAQHHGIRRLGAVRALGAGAVSFGAIHLRTPWKPTPIVQRDLAAGRFRPGRSDRPHDDPSSPRRLTLRAPDNWHAHFRDGPLLDFLVPVFLRSGWRRRIVAEPNTTPPVLTGPHALRYRDADRGRARESTRPPRSRSCRPSRSPKPPRRRRSARRAACGVRVGKVYPFMVTTHSGNGVRDYDQLSPALEAAEDAGTIVQFHGEHPDRRRRGPAQGSGVPGHPGPDPRHAFPGLRLTMEHITSRAAVDWVKAQGERVGASITVHHLFTTVDDVLGYSPRSGGLMRVHCGCKPQPKWRDDQAALSEVVLSGHPRFFYGGDDAAHLRTARNAPAPPAGCGTRRWPCRCWSSCSTRTGSARPARPVPGRVRRGVLRLPAEHGDGDAGARRLACSRGGRGSGAERQRRADVRRRDAGVAGGRAGAMMAGERVFHELLERRWQDGRFLCVGLDPDWERIPDAGEDGRRRRSLARLSPPSAPRSSTATPGPRLRVQAQRSLLRGVRARRACGARQVIRRIRESRARRAGDLRRQARRYRQHQCRLRRHAFDQLGADAITVHPYLGRESLQPFLDRADKGIIVLCRTSNPGGGEFQDLARSAASRSTRSWRERVAPAWNANGNCALVVGATYPEELAAGARHRRATCRS